MIKVHIRDKAIKRVNNVRFRGNGSIPRFSAGPCVLVQLKRTFILAKHANKIDYSSSQ